VGACAGGTRSGAAARLEAGDSLRWILKDRSILEHQMARPRRGKLILLAPPPGERVRKYIAAVVAFTTPEWVSVDVETETWRFRAGTACSSAAPPS
jgi:hypothetical protein